MHAEGVLAPVVITLPDSLAERVEADDVAAVGRELLQQRALGAGQGQGVPAGQRDGGVAQVHPAPAQPQRAGSRPLQFGTVGAAQNQLHAQQQFLGQKRFGQVIVRPKA